MNRKLKGCPKAAVTTAISAVQWVSWLMAVYSSRTKTEAITSLHPLQITHHTSPCSADKDSILAFIFGTLFPFLVHIRKLKLSSMRPNINIHHTYEHSTWRKCISSQWASALNDSTADISSLKPPFTFWFIHFDFMGVGVICKYFYFSEEDYSVPPIAEDL